MNTYFGSQYFSGNNTLFTRTQLTLPTTAPSLVVDSAAAAAAVDDCAFSSTPPPPSPCILGFRRARDLLCSRRRRRRRRPLSLDDSENNFLTRSEAATSLSGRHYLRTSWEQCSSFGFVECVGYAVTNKRTG